VGRLAAEAVAQASSPADSGDGRLIRLGAAGPTTGADGPTTGADGPTTSTDGPGGAPSTPIGPFFIRAAYEVGLAIRGA
jgi:hypothetical protein